MSCNLLDIEADIYAMLKIYNYIYAILRMYDYTLIKYRHLYLLCVKYFLLAEPEYNFVDTLKDVEVLEHNSGEMVCLVSHECAPVSIL